MKGQLVDNRYEVIDRLGVGGMATVYLVHDQKSDKKVALKVMRSSLSDPSTVKRFVREFQACARLSHENIVKIYDLGKCDGTYYYTMEYLTNPSLEVILEERGILSEEETYLLVEQMAKAFSYFHAEGVVHRDLKPANVILGPDGHVVIVDFGLARDAEMTALTQTGTMLGTPRYMPPEQVRGERASATSDIWALGVMLYEVLTGDKLFVGSDLNSIMTSVVCSKIPTLAEKRKDLRWNWQPLLDGCLQRDSEERLASGDEVLALLQEVKGQKLKELPPKSIARERAKPLDGRVSHSHAKTKGHWFLLPLILIVGALVFFRMNKIVYDVTNFKVTELPRKLIVTWKSENPYPSSLFIEKPYERILAGKEKQPMKAHRFVIDGLRDNEQCSFRIIFPNGEKSLSKRGAAKRLIIKIANQNGDYSDRLSFSMNCQPEKVFLKSEKDQHIATFQGEGLYSISFPPKKRLVKPHDLVLVDEGTEMSISLNELLEEEVINLKRQMSTFNGEKMAIAKEGTMSSRLRTSKFLPLYDHGRALAPFVLPNRSLPFDKRRQLFYELRKVWDYYLYAVFRGRSLTLSKPDFGPFEMTIKAYGRADKEIVIFDGKQHSFLIGGKVVFDPVKVLSKWQDTFVLENVTDYESAELEFILSSFNRIGLRSTINNELTAISYGLPILKFPYLDSQKVYQRLPVEVLKEGENSLKMVPSQVYDQLSSRKITVERISLRLYRTYLE